MSVRAQEQKAADDLCSCAPVQLSLVGVIV